MFVELLEFYVRIFSVLIPAIVVAGLAILAKLAQLRPAQIAMSVGVAALGFGVWHGLVVEAAQRGLLEPGDTATSPPIVLMFLFGGAALLWGLTMGTHAGRRIYAQADQRFLLGLQVLRIMGGVFVIGWALGHLPWQFAIPAGFGDMLAGFAAIQALRALNAGRADAVRLVRRANYIGLADFALAIVLGLVTSDGFAQLMSHDLPNIVNKYPLGLFPGFFVPIFLWLHILSLRKGRGVAPRSA